MYALYVPCWPLTLTRTTLTRIAPARLAQNKEELVLRAFNFCIVDEVDSILIDEARTPLIISGAAEKPSARYIKCAKLSDAMQPDLHYKVRG